MRTASDGQAHLAIRAAPRYNDNHGHENYLRGSHVTARLALIIAVDAHQESAALPDTGCAVSDARAFARALEALGCAADQQTVLLDGQATRTAIESRLRKLAKSPPQAEVLYVWLAGHVFHEGGQDYLCCFDTQPDDLAATSLALQTLLDTLGAYSVQRLALFLDDRGTAPSTERRTDQELQHFFATRPGSACFLSCKGDEISQVSGTLKAGIWAHHVLEAFTGKAPLALEDGDVLTAASLQDHLQREVPRTLRTTFREAPAQTPVQIAPPTRVILAELGPLLDQDQPTADPRLQPLQRASLRSEMTARVKSLTGFRKFHRLPERVNASARKFVADLSADDIKADVDQVYATVREQLGYKRRDVEGSADRGSGFVRTPDFEYSVSIDLSDDDPTTVVWRREVAGIRNPSVVLGKPFQQVFGGLFDTLAFEFTRPFDLEAWVDRIEEAMPPGVKLRCSSDCSTCDVMVTGFAGVIRLSRDRVEVQGQKTPGSKGLVEAFLRFQDLFAGRTDLVELPLLEQKPE
jgi:uncharacterized caspase-like protein